MKYLKKYNYFLSLIRLNEQSEDNSKGEDQYKIFKTPRDPWDYGVDKDGMWWTKREPTKRNPKKVDWVKFRDRFKDDKDRFAKIIKILDDRYPEARTEDQKKSDKDYIEGKESQTTVKEPEKEKEAQKEKETEKEKEPQKDKETSTSDQVVTDTETTKTADVKTDQPPVEKTDKEKAKLFYEKGKELLDRVDPKKSAEEKAVELKKPWDYFILAAKYGHKGSKKSIDKIALDNFNLGNDKHAAKDYKTAKEYWSVAAHYGHTGCIEYCKTYKIDYGVKELEDLEKQTLNPTVETAPEPNVTNQGGTAPSVSITPSGSSKQSLIEKLYLGIKEEMRTYYTKRKGFDHMRNYSAAWKTIEQNGSTEGSKNYAKLGKWFYLRFVSISPTDPTPKDKTLMTTGIDTDVNKTTGEITGKFKDELGFYFDNFIDQSLLSKNLLKAVGGDGNREGLFVKWWIKQNTYGLDDVFREFSVHRDFNKDFKEKFGYLESGVDGFKKFLKAESDFVNDWAQETGIIPKGQNLYTYYNSLPDDKNWNPSQKLLDSMSEYTRANYDFVKKNSGQIHCLRCDTYFKGKEGDHCPKCPKEEPKDKITLSNIPWTKIPWRAVGTGLSPHMRFGVGGGFK